jgi:hypothetical protein
MDMICKSVLSAGVLWDGSGPGYCVVRSRGLQLNLYGWKVSDEVYR